MELHKFCLLKPALAYRELWFFRFPSWNENRYLYSTYAECYTRNTEISLLKAYETILIFKHCSFILRQMVYHRKPRRYWFCPIQCSVAALHDEGFITHRDTGESATLGMEAWNHSWTAHLEKFKYSLCVFYWDNDFHSFCLYLMPPF